MPCSNLSDCISDPLSGLPGANTFSTLGNTLTFSINLFLYVLYAVLIVMIGYFLSKTIASLFSGGSDTSETYEKVRIGVTNAVLAAVGIVLLVSARFILVQILSLMGVPDADNIFMGNPFH